MSSRAALTLVSNFIISLLIVLTLVIRLVVNNLIVLIEPTTPSNICFIITKMNPPMTIAAAMGAPTSVIKPKISIGLPETCPAFQKTLLLVLKLHKLFAS